MKPFSHYLLALNIRSNTIAYKRKGWNTDRKIIVIESDDWGSIRMPSTRTLNYLLSKGVKLNPGSGYDKYDTLASNEDIEALFEALTSVRDKHGNQARITLNTVMVNPDFNKIKESNYSEYHYEIFTETLRRYPNHNRSFSLWQEGIRSKIIKPQFHCREHLNVQLWLKGLRDDYPGTRDAFEKEVFCNYFDPTIDKRGRFLEAFNASKEEDYLSIFNSIQDGLQLFEKVFGFNSTSMIAPNYIWDDRIEELAHLNGVKYLQGGIMQKYTLAAINETHKSYRFHYIGELNRHNQLYLTRNCLFEPSSSNNRNSASQCLKEIQWAFCNNKPAIICSHRLNYIGGLDLRNRDSNLRQLKYILSEIVKRYPEVEFMFSDELGDIIHHEIMNNR